MIKVSKQINILDMVDKKEIDRKQKEKELLNKGILLIKTMKKECKTDKQIETQIKELNLPFGAHLALLGNYSEILKYGRILTKNERKLFNS